MKKFITASFLFVLSLVVTAPQAYASASAYEHYSLSSGPSVCAAQITGITGTTLYFAGGSESVVTDWNWWVANSPSVGGYIYTSCSQQSALTPTAWSSFEFASENSFEGDYAMETYAHGGHEPVVIIVD